MSDPLELELLAIVNHLTRQLEIELGSSGKTLGGLIY